MTTITLKKTRDAIAWIDAVNIAKAMQALGTGRAYFAAKTSDDEYIVGYKIPTPKNPSATVVTVNSMNCVPASMLMNR